MTDNPQAEFTAAALRDRIADAIREWHGDWSKATFAEAADAVLAVLPAPADRAAILRELASSIQSGGVPFNTDAAEAALKNGGPFALIAYVQLAIGEHLRRMADEAQQAEAHPAEHTWAAELHDPLADEWVPGTRYTARDRAVKALTHGRSVGPTWKDGTPTQRRLVRATTTYTVEADQPAAAPQPGKEA